MWTRGDFVAGFAARHGRSCGATDSCAQSSERNKRAVHGYYFKPVNRQGNQRSWGKQEQKKEDHQGLPAGNKSSPQKSGSKVA